MLSPMQSKLGGKAANCCEASRWGFALRPCSLQRSSPAGLHQTFPVWPFGQRAVRQAAAVEGNFLVRNCHAEIIQKPGCKKFGSRRVRAEGKSEA